jgi:hypothetical protein
MTPWILIEFYRGSAGEQTSSAFREKQCKGKQAASTERKYLVTRRTTDAIKHSMELCEQVQIAGRILPVPAQYLITRSEGVGGGNFVKEERLQLSTDVTERQSAEGK